MRRPLKVGRVTSATPTPFSFYNLTEIPNLGESIGTLSMKKFFRFVTCEIIVGGLAVLSVIFELVHCASKDDFGPLWDSLAVSWISASLIYLLTEKLPQLKIKEQNQKILIRYRRALYELFRELVGVAKGYIMFPNWPESKDAFCERFSSLEFTSQQKQKLDKLRTKIHDLYCEMQVYRDFYSDKDFQIVKTIQFSDFIRNEFYFKEWGLPEEYRDIYPNNQDDLGESIWELYALRLKYYPSDYDYRKRTWWVYRLVKVKCLRFTRKKL
jgi:hypothetical protein